MASIESLSTELLQSIFEYIFDTSPKTITSLMRISKRFHDTAFSIQNRHQSFTFYNAGKVPPRSEQCRETAGKTFQRLFFGIKSAQVIECIRHITVKSSRGVRNNDAYGEEWTEKEADVRRWGQLVQVVETLPHLKSLTWQRSTFENVPAFPIPVLLLDTLEKYHPKAELHVRDWGRGSDDANHQVTAELALARSPNLRSIQAKFTRAHPLHKLRIAALERIIALSPNLEEVEVYQSYSIHDMTRLLTPSELTTLTQQAISFKVESSIKSIKSLKLLGYASLSPGVTDISKVTTLHINYVEPAYFSDQNPIGASNFKSLKHFSFSFLNTGKIYSDIPGYNHHAFDEFLATCKPLESLEIKDRQSYASLAPILNFHGDTLKKLAFHDTESSNQSHQPRPLSYADIKEICRRCPLLEDLTIDMKKGSPSETCKAILCLLATIPRLSIIRLHIPLGVAEEAARTPWVVLDEEEARQEETAHKRNPYSPFQSQQWLENSWSLLDSEKKKNGTGKVKELHVKVGEWDRVLGSGYPAGWLVWEAANRRYFVATAPERDDVEDHINVHVMKAGLMGDLIESWEVKRLPKVSDEGHLDFGMKAAESYHLIDYAD